MQVEFVISYTGRGELVTATVNAILADVDLGEVLLQTHSVQFRVRLQTQMLSLNELNIQTLPIILLLPCSWLHPDQQRRGCSLLPDFRWGLQLWDVLMKKWSLYPNQQPRKLFWVFFQLSQLTSKILYTTIWRMYRKKCIFSWKKIL